MISIPPLTILLWIGSNIPFGYNEFPCPQEYKIETFTHVCGSPDGKCTALGNNKLICIIKADYEK